MKRGNNGLNQNVKNLAIGLVAGIGVSLLLSAIAAATISAGTIGEGMLGTVCLIIHGISSFVAGMTAGKLCQEKRGLYAGAASGGYLLSWIGAALLFWEGIQNNFMYVLIAAIVGAVLSWFLLMVPKGNNKRRMYLKRFS